MVQTILISKYIQIQGAFVRALENGNIIVSTGKGQFEGQPISAEPKPSSHVVLAVS